MIIAILLEIEPNLLKVLHKRDKVSRIIAPFNQSEKIIRKTGQVLRTAPSPKKQSKKKFEPLSEVENLEP